MSELKPIPCPWLVRMLCTDCGTEHYRYFNKSQTSPVVITQGQCRICFDNTQAAMLSFNMIQQPIGQRAWVNSFHADATNQTFTAAINWHYSAQRAVSNLRDTIKLINSLKLKLQKKNKNNA